jgi:hypothetical protein
MGKGQFRKEWPVPESGRMAHDDIRIKRYRVDAAV